MRYRYLFIIIVLISIFVSINAISAEEIDLNNTMLNEMHVDFQNSEMNLNQISEDPLSDSQVGPLQSENFNHRDIYVGSNVTVDGDGSIDNPFASLKLARDNVSGEDSITVNIFNGTYLVGSELKFNTSNLIINGIGEVIIKNELTTAGSKQAIELCSPLANFTMNNIIFDESGWTLTTNNNNFFVPFYGDANYGTFNNCTFLANPNPVNNKGTFNLNFGNKITGSNEYNATYKNCIFKDFATRYFFINSLYNGGDARDTDYGFVQFENCVFLNQKMQSFQNNMVTDKNISLDKVWFGQNSIPSYLSLNAQFPNGNTAPSMTIPVIRYAEFSVSENYLGNNEYEIIGKLCWNGTNDTVGDSFAPMTVTLTYGDVSETVTLENGIFIKSYTGNSSGVNTLTATLDYQPITLNFVNLDIELNSPSILYGQDQNITVTFPQNVTGTVNITVNNKTYEVKVNDSKSVTYTIKDVNLTEGNYSVDVLFVGKDQDNNLWALNSTNLEVSKWDKYPFYLIDFADDVKVGDVATVNIELPDDVTGDVNVTFGNVTKIVPAAAVMAVEFTNLNATTYPVTVTYMGNDKYVSKTKYGSLIVTKSVPSMNVAVEPAENITVKDNVTLTVKLPSDATGDVVIKVNGKKVHDSSANETTIINLNNAPGDYIVDVIYSGDEKYESDTETKEFTISKAKTSITANQTAFEEGNASTIEVKIPDINSGIVLVDVEGKKFYGDINNGKASITLEGLPEGNYTANIKFFGDELHKEATCTASVKVSEPKIITELKEQLEEAQANASQLKDELDNVSGQLVDAQANATQLKENLAELNQTITGKDAEISNLTDVVAGKDAEISNLTDVVAGKDAEISNLTDAVSVKDSVIDSQTEQIGNLNDTVNDLRAIIDSLKDQNVTVVVDGQEYTVEVVNGTATIETNKTEPKKASEFSEITIGDNQTVSLVLKDEDGNVIANAPITYTVNGAVNTTTTDKDGKFTIQGENGALITIAYAGDANITGTNTTLKLNSQAVPEVVKVAAHFNISDRAITIKGYAVDGPAGEQGIYYATTVLDENGNPIPNVYIEFAVNNKIYNRTTDENGSFVPYKLNMVRAGRYTMAFNYAGDDNYTNAFACVCVDLDKKPITIKAPAKTYKAAAKTKKYTVTLSTIPSVHDGKVYLSPKKVTLKVNGKTYTGKTNNNGQVTFKIINLNKKGKYTAKISYEGDKTYESATQKVKLNIK